LLVYAGLETESPENDPVKLSTATGFFGNSWTKYTDVLFVTAIRAPRLLFHCSCLLRSNSYELSLCITLLLKLSL
jgi:hypothetical protein